jgi:cell division protein ZapA (FtsZ GTPase activity inhibitor)
MVRRFIYASNAVWKIGTSAWNSSAGQFRLRCDNHERTLRAAKEIDRLLDVLRQNSTDQSTMTLAILAALNVAERHDWLSEHHRKTVDYLCQELRAMHLHIEQSIAEAVAAAA